MNYTNLFYWLVVADNARFIFEIFLWVFLIIAIISTLCFIFGRQSIDDNLECPKDGIAERSKKWIWFSYPFLIFFCLLYVLTPSKKDSLLIIAGGGTLNFLTTDKSAKQIPTELSNFILTEIKNMAKDAEVDLNIKNQREKILEDAKNMTAEELLHKMNKDSTYTKILLNK